MNHDVATGRQPALRSTPLVFFVRVGNMNGLVIPAFCIPPVEDVMAFRSLVISLLDLRPDWHTSECNLIGTNHFPLCQQYQSPIAFDNDHPVGFLRSKSQREILS